MTDINFVPYLSAALGFHSLFMVLYLFSERSETRIHYQMLGCVFILLGAWFFTEFLERSGVFARYPMIIGWPTVWSPLLIPSLYFYVVAISARRRWSLKEVSRWHWIFAGGILLLELPIQFSSPEMKLLQVSTYASLPEVGDPLVLKLSKIHHLLMMLQGAVYIGLSVRRILRHDKRVKSYFSNLENRRLIWLRNYILLLILMWLLGVSDFLHLQDAMMGVLHFVTAAWLMAFSIYGIRQDRVFAGMKLGEEKQEQTEEAKPLKKQVSDDRRERIARKIRHAVDEDHLYRDADLTLRKLSDAIGVSTHHISETLRDEIGLNFYDYINGCRITEACEILTSTDQATIDIAYAVGFNSRSTFSAAFKKHTETSPAQYRKDRKTMS
ncbi:helix-turn-helix transcriptional regulator [Kordiimonas laminariae]|uniref:helix-turn-helix transcriptional regulator n=1 Tax=Kordiimonas laminariae TaxID=2917717 RepID=UPI001FF3D54A|nr:helix-turn-helix transcriptional regulator [Kordiimonas laminariae]MCK0070746.1 helix-turn-helix transcriptional regulator [Kordiimonas laminariae]